MKKIYHAPPFRHCEHIKSLRDKTQQDIIQMSDSYVSISEMSRLLWLAIHHDDKHYRKILKTMKKIKKSEKNT